MPKEPENLRFLLLAMLHCAIGAICCVIVIHFANNGSFLKKIH